MRRFNFGIRLKWIIDDPTIVYPYIKIDIPSITVTAGHPKVYGPLDTYFYPACSYYKAK
jgi:hypothetical protein